jgi:hypothetical protein
MPMAPPRRVIPFPPLARRPLGFAKGGIVASGGDPAGEIDPNALLPWEDWADVYTPHELNRYAQVVGQFNPSMYMPPSGTPGFIQGPTMIPTSFDPQGYPYAVPVSTPDILGGYQYATGVPKKQPV